MNFGEYRVAFIVVTAIIMLLVASPALSRLLVYPQTEFFTEMWLLGPSHMAEDYPYNVTSGQNCTVYLGLGNHLGYCAYYLVEVKFRNETQSEPSSFGSIENRTPSSMPSLFNITAFVADGQDWELPIGFSFDFMYNETIGQVYFGSMKLNGVTLSLDGYTTTWDSSRGVFSGNLFFEAWLYNASSNSFQYHARFVGLQLNMT